MQAEKKTGTGADEKNSKTEEEVKVFDGDFVKVDQGTLFELILVRPPPQHASHQDIKVQDVIPSLHLAGLVRAGHGSLLLGMMLALGLGIAASASVQGGRKVHTLPSPVLSAATCRALP